MKGIHTPSNLHYILPAGFFKNLTWSLFFLSTHVFIVSHCGTPTPPTTHPTPVLDHLLISLFLVHILKCSTQWLPHFFLQGSVLYNWFNNGKLERSEGSSATEGTPDFRSDLILFREWLKSANPIAKEFTMERNCSQSCEAHSPVLQCICKLINLKDHFSLLYIEENRRKYSFCDHHIHRSNSADPRMISQPVWLSD